MTDTDTRVSVIIGVRNQDPDRWREFIAIYRPMLFAYLLKQGLSEADAYDVLQDVYLKLVEKIGTYDRTRTRFRTWLFTVARNALIDKARRQKAHKRALDEWARRMLDDNPSESRKMEDVWRKIHCERILAHAVNTVRERTSTVVWSCFEQRIFKNRPGAEIAAELGVSTNAVFVYTCRVLKKIRTICDEYGEDLSHASNDGMP